MWSRRPGPAKCAIEDRSESLSLIDADALVNLVGRGKPHSTEFRKIRHLCGRASQSAVSHAGAPADRKSIGRCRVILKDDQSRNRVFSKLDAIRDVPTLPTIALRAAEIANDEASSARELANFISQDQALTATLLTMTNAAAYGVAGKVATVDRAVILMGFEKVRTMVLLSSASNFFAGESDCLDRASLWRHSIGTATAAEVLARGEAGIDPAAAYIAGLLHEVGIVILDRYFHDDLRAAVEA